MTNEPSTLVSETKSLVCDRHRYPSLCWKAIFGGTVAAIGIHILLTLLGAGAGLAIFSPQTDDNPVLHFNVGAAIIWSVCALVALWFGGFLAGRFSHSWHSGFVHGVLVWSLTLIITLLLLSKGVGLILGGGLKMVGAGLSIGSEAAAAGASSLANEGLKRSAAEIESFIEEATQSAPTNSAAKVLTQAKREIGFAVTKLFSPHNDIDSKDNRAAAITALQNYAHLSETDAARTVDGWIASYKNLKTEIEKAKAAAEQKAREIADQAAHNLSCAAAWSFFALLIGLLVAALGGSCGGKCAVRHYGPHNENVLI